MSYARFGWGGSDVYVTLDLHGSLRCHSCALMPEVPSPPALVPGFHESFDAFTTADMLAHLDAHREAGYRVLNETFDELRADADENDAWLTGQLRADA